MDFGFDFLANVPACFHRLGYLTILKTITMYTNKSIRLHNKCLGILEMLQKVTNRIEDNKRSIKINKEGTPNWFYTGSFFEEQLQKNIAIQYRLALYYVNVLNAASQEGCKQVAKLLINS